MYAIVETGGKQYRVKPGDTIAVERIVGEPGDVLDLERVLLVAGNGDAARIGVPGVAGAVVRAELVEHARGEKIIVFRYKSKVRYRRKTGHRQALTRIRITDILLDGKSTTAAATATSERPTAATATSEAPTAATTEQAPARRRRAAAAPPADTELPASAGEAGPPPAQTQPEEAETEA